MREEHVYVGQASPYSHSGASHAVRIILISLPGWLKFRFRRQIFGVGVSVGPPSRACSPEEAESGRAGAWRGAADRRLAILPAARAGARRGRARALVHEAGCVQ